MAEQKRGCGWRKIGGLYLVCDGPGTPCRVLPYHLDTCPVCGAGVKFCRGWTWVSRAVFAFERDRCRRCRAVGQCAFTGDHDRLGLLWVGGKFYPTPGDFDREARAQGISRRIQHLPKGFVVGETWVALAHLRAVPRTIPVAVGQLPLPGQEETAWLPGVFAAFRPTRVELVVTEEMLRDPAVRERVERQGLTPVVVPDDPRHH